jgi:hypothetical protein
MTSKLVTTSQAAEILGIKPNTLEGWRIRGEGPPFLKIGRLVKYDETDLIDYIKRQTRHSTSEENASKSYTTEPSPIRLTAACKTCHHSDCVCQVTQGQQASQCIGHAAKPRRSRRA